MSVHIPISYRNINILIFTLNMYFTEEQRILQIVTYPLYLLQGLCLKFQHISNSQIAN